MDKIWTTAFSVAGIGAVAFFVFYSLHRQWLSLSIFQRLSRNQTFALMALFLVLTFGSLVAGLLAWHLTSQAEHPAGPRPEPPPEATREFIIGHWEVMQKSGNVEGGTATDFDDNGTFTGTIQVFVNGQGRSQRTAGTWTFRQLSKNQFGLLMNYSTGQGRLEGTFRVIDRNRVHCVDQNYDAVRVER